MTQHNICVDIDRQSLLVREARAALIDKVSLWAVAASQLDEQRIHDETLLRRLRANLKASVKVIPYATNRGLVNAIRTLMDDIDNRLAMTFHDVGNVPLPELVGAGEGGE